MNGPAEATPIQAVPVNLERTGMWAYQIGTHKRYWWRIRVPQNFPFGRTMLRFETVSRAYFYDALMATRLISPRSDFDSVDVLMSTGYRMEAGPYVFRVVPA